MGGRVAPGRQTARGPDPGSSGVREEKDHPPQSSLARKQRCGPGSGGRTQDWAVRALAPGPGLWPGSSHALRHSLQAPSAQH